MFAPHRTFSEITLREEAFGGLHAWARTLGSGGLTKDNSGNLFFKWRGHVFICYLSAICVRRGDQPWFFYETDLEELKALMTLVLFTNV